MSALVVYAGSGVSGVDAKGRTTIPAELRDSVQQSSGANSVCISRHRDLPCLIGFGGAERLKLRADIEAQWESAVNRGVEFDRELAGVAASSIFETAFEASGRFVLSPMLRHFGKIEDRAFFFGATTHFMLWNPDVFLKEAPSAFDPIKDELNYWLAQGEARMTAQAPHIPVLLDEVIHALAITPGAEIVDGTFGAGGYSEAILAGGARVYAFDRDPDALSEGVDLAGRSGGALRLYSACFSDMDDVLAADDITSVDGVVLDIGVSSMQLDRAERGFSFQKDGPLDMRMAQDGMTAAEFVNEADEGEIADIIYRYGEEHRSRRIARAIVAARPIDTTAQLATIVRKAVGHKPGAPKDPATRTFQAIRIHINRELDELNEGLEAAERLLKPGGRLAVVTFHSLEDRIVKQFLRRRSGAEGAGSRHIPTVANASPAPTFDKADKAVRPSDAEVNRNPRARSATLRSATRTSAPAWAEGGLAA